MFGMGLVHMSATETNTSLAHCSLKSSCPGQIEHLYSLTVFENYLYATNSDNGNVQPKTSVIRVNRFNSSDYQVVTRVDKGGALHVYHQRRQPPGTRAPILVALPCIGQWLIASVAFSYSFW